jgi:hypothetical protein
MHELQRLVSINTCCNSKAIAKQLKCYSSSSISSGAMFADMSFLLSLCRSCLTALPTAADCVVVVPIK